MKLFVFLLITILASEVAAQASNLAPALLIAPQNEELNRGLVNTLVWHKVDNATVYKISVSFQKDFKTEFCETGFIGDTIYNLQTMPFGTTYFWRVQSSDAAGDISYSDIWQFTTTSLVGVQKKILGRPLSISNYPNPFSSKTTITYSVSDPGTDVISLINILGKKVETIQAGYSEAGNHSLVLDGDLLSSGFYFLTIESNGTKASNSIQIVK